MRTDPADVALRQLERLIGRDPLLRDIVHPSLPAARRQARFVPAVDVVEGADAWTLLIEVPGVPRDKLSVRLDGSRLTVSGEKPALRTGDARTAERESGPFQREFLLPFQVRPDGIRARLADGLLTVILPREGTAGAREVPVE